MVAEGGLTEELYGLGINLILFKWNASQGSAVSCHSYFFELVVVMPPTCENFMPRI